MKTLNLYAVIYETTSGARRTFNVAAETLTAAKKQTKEYSRTITKVIHAQRIGNVNVPVNLPSGL